MNFKLKLCFKDRIGIIADISKCVAVNGLNIIFMEVVRKNDNTHVYMEIESHSQFNNLDRIVDMLKATRDLKEINFVDTLPQEEREDRFRVVLDNISDGVLSIDRDGKVTTINKVAARAHNRVPVEVIGRNIRELERSQYAILDCLEGKSIKNAKQNLITSERRYQYISTCRPLRDTSGMIVGAVEINKDMQEIKQIAQTFSDPGLINFSDIIGNDPTLKQAIAFAQKIATTDAPVAIRGASGTGKELFAHALHTGSNRTGIFVPINCAALPDPLLESELFGYVEGSFTGGKKKGKAGLFETAKNGTVFLDEIAEMSLASQAKLLRLIQEGAVRRIGDTKEIPINARIVTATNKNLEHLVEKKAFRKDLYYRVSVLPIHIPPLSQRLDDIPLLIEHFLFQLANKLEKKMPSLTQGAFEKLRQHNWPGNIRELKNVVERAAILCEDQTIDIDSILFSHEMNNHTRHPGTGFSINNSSLKEQVADLEQKIIVKTLKNAKTIRRSARNLKISHPALINKMKKYNIKMVTKVNSFHYPAHANP